MTIRTVSFTVPAPDKFLNMNDRLHWTERDRRNGTWRDAAFWWAKQHGVWCREAIGVVDVWFEIGTNQPNKKRDPHNWFPTIKAICDGFTLAAVWEDDDSEHVRTSEPTFTDQVPHGSVRITLHWEVADVDA